MRKRYEKGNPQIARHMQLQNTMLEKNLSMNIKPEYRKRGITEKLMEQLITEAGELGLDYVELKSAEDGYRVYKSLGFGEKQSKYRPMKKML